MSSNFLQRFKGKTQTISKDGVHDLLGGRNQADVKIYTHSNGIQNNPKIKSSNSVNANIPIHPKGQTTNSIHNGTKKVNQNRQNVSLNKTNDSKFRNQPIEKQKQNLRQIMKQKQKQKLQKQRQKANQNPFLISNPFYLDEQQKKRQEQQRRQIEKQQKLQRQNKKKQDQKNGTYTSMSLKKASETKKSDKQWVKMGGLGANIGGDQWEQKRKKQQKMQQFANQVKAINIEKNRIPKPISYKVQERKDNPRNKALQYSKNVPKPVVKSFYRQEEPQEPQIQIVNKNQLSELELYQLRHKELKEMLRKDL